MTKKLILTAVAVVSAFVTASILTRLLPSGSPFIDWLPGLFFGLAFAVVNLKSRAIAISFMLLSGIAYWAAVMAASHSVMFGGVSSPDSPLVLFIRSVFDTITPGGVGGIVGAAILAASLKFINKTRLASYDLLTVLVGGIAGIAFFKFINLTLISGFLIDAAAYLIWQLPVAFTLVLGLPRHGIEEPPVRPSPTMEVIGKFLQSPIFIILGTIVNLIALYDFFTRFNNVPPTQ